MRCGSRSRGDGVKVVLVEPGGFKTGIWEEFERDIAKREAEGSRHVPAVPTLLAGTTPHGADHGQPASMCPRDRRRADVAVSPAVATSLVSTRKHFCSPSGSRPHL